ncbi:gamma-butyrobetaine hydroxylase-like domain-containing protein [Xanthobacter sp. V0B-10]|uniref:gamma-butyrobetaine hydroxylase-like domain-containing protein n=1 Tax=Xanthobacter albus TaxID=3119929 RepID=UPI00372A13A9
MTTPNPNPPVEIRLSADKRRLTLVWEDGAVEALGAPELRARSQSAGEKRLRVIGIEAPVRADITVTGVSLLGSYGLNLSFSDGHDRGIYPWALLREIGQDAGIEGEVPLPRVNAIP